MEQDKVTGRETARVSNEFTESMPASSPGLRIDATTLYAQVSDHEAHLANTELPLCCSSQ